jgi:hypothetical protein
MSSGAAAMSYFASRTASSDATIANWLPRSKRRAFMGGISGCGEKPSHRATSVA